MNELTPKIEGESGHERMRRLRERNPDIDEIYYIGHEEGHNEAVTTAEMRVGVSGLTSVQAAIGCQDG